ncbi:alpha/beta fold hydrolase [Flexivirga endophytica]|nr:alpha/beta hydrolase [Flexivirga endophytica]GHB50514.1 alpha/beta hydrolase [Flexivirga endophytica]
MSGLHVHRVTTDDGALLSAYIREPVGAPTGTVVLGHGWILDHRSWLPVLRTLDPSLRVVLWDQRGHGSSTLAGGSRKVGHQSIKRLGADLRSVISELTPADEQLVLGGHSMGGMTILAYAGIAPEEFAARVRGVVLVSTAAGGLRGTGRPGERRVMSALRHVGVPLGRGMTEKAHRAAAFGRGADPADVHDATVITRGTRLSVVGGFYDALMQHDEVAALAGMQNVPTRVLVGRRDRLTPPTLAQRIAAGLPAAELTTFDDLGHMLPWEAPDQVAKAIEDLAR